MRDKKNSSYLRVLGQEDHRRPVDTAHERELANIWFAGAVFFFLATVLGLLLFRTMTGSVLVVVFGPLLLVAIGLFVYHHYRSNLDS